MAKKLKPKHPSNSTPHPNNLSDFSDEGMVFLAVFRGCGCMENLLRQQTNRACSYLSRSSNAKPNSVRNVARGVVFRQL